MQESIKQIRLNRVFGRDRRSVIVAMDHGSAGISPLAGLQDPGTLIPGVIQGGADALITTPGIVSRYPGLFQGVGIILRIDGGPSGLTGEWEKIEVCLTVEDALRLGADAVIMMGIAGAAGETETMTAMWKAAAICRSWGVPLVAEMLPGGFAAKDTTIEQMTVAARLAAEVGADVVKIRYKGPAKDFSQVTAATFVPVVILGGSKQPLEMLTGEVREALSAGAAGVAVGRNVWQDADPAQVVRALKQAVHTA